VGGGEPLVEVHLFDFDGDLYGKALETRFVRRLRGELDFPGLEALVEQMKNDESEARAVLAAASAE
jgi:riboflavin kinase/FMN adenylyltransferase